MSRMVMIVGVLALALIAGAVMFMNANKQETAQTPVATPTPIESGPTETSTEGQKAEHNVTIQNFAFGPKTLTVKVGEKVTWTNKDTAGHSATADDESFDTSVLEQNESGSVVFDKAGTYEYHCTPHPNMRATIVVEE